MDSHPSSAGADTSATETTRRPRQYDPDLPLRHALRDMAMMRSSGRYDRGMEAEASLPRLVREAIGRCWTGDGGRLMRRLDWLITGSGLPGPLFDTFVDFYTSDELTRDLQLHRVDARGLRRHCDLLDAWGRRLPQADARRVYDAVAGLGGRMAFNAPYNPDEYGHLLVDICAPFYLRIGDRTALTSVLRSYILNTTWPTPGARGKIDMARVASAVRMLMLAVSDRRDDGTMTCHPRPFEADILFDILQWTEGMDAGQSREAGMCRILADAMNRWLWAQRHPKSPVTRSALSDRVIDELPDQRHIMECLKHDMEADADGAVDGTWLLTKGTLPKDAGHGFLYGNGIAGDPDWTPTDPRERLEPDTRHVQLLEAECTRMGAIHMYVLLETGGPSPYAVFERIRERLEAIDLAPLLRAAVEHDGNAVIHEPWIWWLLVHYLGASMETLRLLHLPVADGAGQRHRDLDDPVILRWRGRLADMASTWTELIERSGKPRHPLADILLRDLTKARECAATGYRAIFD